jgi:hypothetical protein
MSNQTEDFMSTRSLKMSRGWLLLVCLLASCLTLPLFSQELKIEGPLPARSGETCIVCNQPVTAEDLAYVVNGQRIAVKRELQQEFLNNPRMYLSKYKPEGMLFSAYSAGNMGSGYLWLGLYIFAGLCFGALTANLSFRKGEAPWKWFLLGLFLNVLAFLMLNAKKDVPEAADLPAGLKKIPTTKAPTICPNCGSGNHPSARNCSTCGFELHPTVKPEVGA